MTRQSQKKRVAEAAARRKAPPGVSLIDPERVPELLARVAAPRVGHAPVRARKRWYVITLPLAHRRMGSERMGWVLAFADSESTAAEMARDPKLAPGMQRERIGSVREASPSDLLWLRQIPRGRLATRPAWTCWELAGTTASDY